MEECLQQSCHETVMLTCGTEAGQYDIAALNRGQHADTRGFPVRRQLPTISIPGEQSVRIVVLLLG